MDYVSKKLSPVLYTGNTMKMGREFLGLQYEFIGKSVQVGIEGRTLGSQVRGLFFYFFF